MSEKPTIKMTEERRAMLQRLMDVVNEQYGSSILVNDQHPHYAEMMELERQKLNLFLNPFEGHSVTVTGVNVVMLPDERGVPVPRMKLSVKVSERPVN